MAIYSGWVVGSVGQFVGVHKAKERTVCYNNNNVWGCATVKLGQGPTIEQTDQDGTNIQKTKWNKFGEQS